MVNLETPDSEESLYVARGEDAALFEMRPRFTGDVLQMDADLGIILQHPCAIRRGIGLVDSLLLASVFSIEGPVPTNWAEGHFKKFFLPDLLGDGTNFSATFASPVVRSAADVASAERLAILSPQGVNLLLQRWVHHNTRVAIPTPTLNDVTVGPFEEADLVGDVCADLVEKGGSRAKAEVLLDAWLGESHQGGSDRRTALEDPQQRSVIRQQARAQTKIWAEDGAASE